ncbi:SNF2-related protein [Azospirillum thermophilum]|uniref:ATP-dependent helicase n=1 Tax=Azospirillum thermophilum TaxID=2202148 RepID=A0A2S2CM11_9PROT|nr:SNF2-related protein [Azospirillum thermophilum]AWK85410.1 ATP-dependent helicase [Azospirillum thermophilum]
MPTPFHTVYFAHELSRSRPASGVERLSQSLVDASIDLNPHQIEAALFALKSPLDSGVILADEVGLGKTIEAGVLLLQSWAERKRRLLVLCPASLRRQWATELEEKFGLPCRILDARSWSASMDAGETNPFDTDREVSIVSYNFAVRQADILLRTAFDLVVIDEAHKLRNAWKPDNVIGQSLKRALAGRRKALLTATPLQNSLMELYGLASFIDDYIFGEAATFRANYTGAGANLEMLRGRLGSFCHRTLREDVQEYVRYTQRRPLTVPFTPTDAEQQLYDRISAFLMRESGFAIPKRQRRLTLLVMRKLLASSSYAIAGTLDTIIRRLEALQRGDAQAADELLRNFISTEEFEDTDSEDVGENKSEGTGDDGTTLSETSMNSPVLAEELEELRRCRALADSMQADTKAHALLKALELGFAEMARTGAARKALVFTESRRTQAHLKAFLEANGYAGSVVAFNGSNTDPDARGILERWLSANRDSGKVTGSRPVDMRTALVEHFRDDASIMLATEAAAEGINLQFCSLVINYDLPWNPQRIEQRIGRCHRYGQKHDVVVVNFINRRNAADRRVYELLDEKFRLFEGVFGASDEVLGALESGIDFERSILAIYQECRTEAEIDAAFARLQAELEDVIRSRMAEARRVLFAHFDEDVHARLRLRMDDARMHLDRTSRMFWLLTRYMLGKMDGAARFDDATLTFDLDRPPLPGVAAGRYQFAVRRRQEESVGHAYRLSHPLAEHLVERAKALETPQSEVLFDLSAHPARISVLEPYRGTWGWLTLTLVTVESFAREEELVLTAIDRRQQPLPREAAEKLFLVPALWRGLAGDPHELIRELLEERCAADANLAVDVARARNARYLEERRQRLDQWADDAIKRAERDLDDVKTRLKELSRQARQTEDPAEQHRIQTEIQAAEREKRRARQRIFEAEDEVMAERDRLIADLRRRIAQKVETRRLFTIKWVVG